MGIRVVVVDDDPLVRSSLRLYFESTNDIEVIAEAGNGVECLEILEESEADLVLADIHMPTMDGISLLREINKLPHPPTFLAVTSFDKDDTMLNILKSGGAGYILKNQRPQSIIDAVREAMQGGTVVAPAAMQRLVDYIDSSRPHAAVPRDPIARAIEDKGLRPNEANILKLLIQGNSNSEIAEALDYAESTVKKHVSHLLREFEVTSRLGLVTKVLSDPEAD